eukprot:TRINITY_DN23102_c0_g2_i1.p1 TRINITY_DN23102_c0_g2~~TRINITY_DN23102_c0_g2_i1.p1  ORF type:complete len:1547 (+),score=287.00 TRINITY_DN23102_c0_g2_i1:692-4642(+)
MVRLGRSLRTSKCVLTSRGERVAPQHILLVGRADARELLESLVSPLAQSAPPGKHLVDVELEKLVPASLLESLGCERLGARHLVQILEAWVPDASFTDGPTELEAAWWRRFLALLDDLLDASGGDEPRLMAALRRTAFLPVVGGREVASACCEGLFLPPEAGLAAKVPRPLLTAMRVVSPSLFSVSRSTFGADRADVVDDAEGSGPSTSVLVDSGVNADLVGARARRLLRRLGVEPLTLRRVVTDFVLPFFDSAAAVATRRDLQLPALVPAHEIGQPLELQRAIAEFAVAHWGELITRDMREDSAVAWPLTSTSINGEESSAEVVAVGVPHRSPPLHLPSPQLNGILAGTDSVVRLCVPYIPDGRLGVEAPTMLRRAGLALPLLRVCRDSVTGDWSCTEFAALAPQQGAPITAAVEARSRNLALALDDQWDVYRQFASYVSGDAEAPSGFLRSLRDRAWLPCSLGGLRKPAELFFKTAAIQAAIPEDAIEDLPCCPLPLRNAAFRGSIGLRQEVDAQLAVELLRLWAVRGCASVSPDGAVALYKLVEGGSSSNGGDGGTSAGSGDRFRDRGSAESLLGALKGFASIVVARGDAPRWPTECVWEDDVGCARSLHALSPIYGPRWRAFFVGGLGVAEEPSLHHCCLALDHMATSGGSTASLHRLLLQMSDGAARGLWTSGALGESLHRRKVFPLLSPPSGDAEGGRRDSPPPGAPVDGLLWLDDCPDAPTEWLEKSLSQALVEPPPLISDAAALASWRLLLDAVGIPSVSVACTFQSRCCAAVEDAELTRVARAFVPLAERYMHRRQPQLHCDLARNAARLSQIKVVLALEAFVECTLVGDSTTIWPREVSVLDESSTPIELHVRRGRDTPWPAFCLAFARAVVPPGPELVRGGCREGLATFLLSARSHVAASAEAELGELCSALHLPPMPPGESWASIACRTVIPHVSGANVAAGQNSGEKASAAVDAEDEVISVDGNEANAEPAMATAEEEVEKAFASLAGTQETTADEEGLPALVDPFGGVLVDPTEIVQLEPDIARRKHSALFPQDEDEEDRLPPKRPRVIRPRSRSVAADSGFFGCKGSSGKWSHGWEDSREVNDQASCHPSRSSWSSSSGRKYAEERGDSGGAAEDAVPLVPWNSSDMWPWGRCDQEERVFASSIVDISTEEWRSTRAELPRLPEAMPSGTASDEELYAVGRWGERFVLAYLRRVLQAQRKDASAVVLKWVNEEGESGLAYDIVVEGEDGQVLSYVEVKTTRTAGRQLIEVSHQEWRLAEEKGSKYTIYRVSNAGGSNVTLAVIPDPHQQWREKRIGVCLNI